MTTIQDKEVKGYSCGEDVTRWYWGDTEVAVIDRKKREIEWCQKTCNFPKEVVEEIRSKMDTNPCVWVIEARRTRQSATQGSIHIFVNNKDMGVNFADNYELIGGKWQSTIPDAELGSYVYASLWNPNDHIYHCSDGFRSIFNPDWKETDKKEGTIQNFYFTFGSSKQYPFERGQYVVVKATDVKKAVKKFMEKYPHPACENTVNCAFYYSQSEWDSYAKAHYENVEPSEVIA